MVRGPGGRGARAGAGAGEAIEDGVRRGRHRHGGGGRGEREGGREGGRGRRVFDHGDLRLVIMALLAEKPSYGYDIIKALEERVGGGYSPSPGVIYPNLTLLEEAGHATVSEAQGGRRLYTLSEQGMAYLAANRTAADKILARVDAAATSRVGPPARVVRALENLETAVRLRLKGRPVTDAETRAIADAIDAAARTVEDI
jgi:DNA-binding PadR family transcriptional regulator